MTDEELLASMEAMLNRLLDARGFAVIVPKSVGALRQKRYRSRQASSVTQRNAGVTKRNAASKEKRNGSVTGHNGSVTITFDFANMKFIGITEDKELKWQDAFPAVPIPPAIDAAAAWLVANPANRKSNYERFLVGWFTRAQDKAGRVRH